LIDYKTLDEPVEVNTAKGKLLGISTGSVHLTVEDQASLTSIVLKEVLHVPGMNSNLLSNYVLLEKGLEISMHFIRGTDIFLGTYIVAKTVLHCKLWRLKRVDGEYTLKIVGSKSEEPHCPSLCNTKFGICPSGPLEPLESRKTCSMNGY
jgi:hypothetical protein